MDIETVANQLKEEYPELAGARALLSQRSYAQAAEVYSKILEDMAENEPETSVKLAIVYLEYGKALLLSNDKLVINPEITEDMLFLEDLEIAWEVLEIAKAIFKNNGLHREHVSALLLLSDISQETNQTEAALADLLEAHSISSSTEPYSANTANICLKVASTHELLQNIPQAISVLQQLINQIETAPEEITNTRQSAEILDILKERIKELQQPAPPQISLKTPHIQMAQDHSSQPVTKLILTKKHTVQPEHSANQTSTQSQQPKDQTSS